MDKMIELKAKDISLLLEKVNDTNWCRVFLLAGEKHFLGADNLKIICSRIISALKKEGLAQKEIYKYKDLELFWILSLSEQHTSIYGTLTDKGGIRLYCIEDGRLFLPAIVLNMHNIDDWILTLDKYI